MLKTLTQRLRRLARKIRPSTGRGFFNREWMHEAAKLAAGELLVMQEVAEEEAVWRLSTCIDCDKLDQRVLQCTVCGCYVEHKSRSKVSRSVARPLGEITHCPLGRWNDLEIVNHYRTLDGMEPLAPEA